MNRKQFPGQEYTFVCKKTGEKDTGILPVEYGLSSNFVIWRKNPHDKSAGGHWQSRKFSLAATLAFSLGLGPKVGLLGRMMRIRAVTKYTAKRRGYASILTSPEEMVEQWKLQNGVCAACGLSGLVLGMGTDYDHNHLTGEGRGFIHHSCNGAEGYLKHLSDENLLQFIKYIRPSLLHT